MIIGLLGLFCSCSSFMVVGGSGGGDDGDGDGGWRFEVRGGLCFSVREREIGAWITPG